MTRRVTKMADTCIRAGTYAAWVHAVNKSTRHAAIIEGGREVAALDSILFSNKIVDLKT